MCNVTGGDLLTLWKVGNVYLPRVAAVYSSASGSVGKTQGTSAKFIVDKSGDHGAIDSPIYAAFDQARNEWQHILAQAATNTYDACDGINKAIDDFKQQDASAGQELDNILKGQKDANGKILHDPNDTDSNPPEDKNGDHRYDRPDKEHGPQEPYDGYDSPGDKGLPKATKDYDGDGDIDHDDAVKQAQDKVKKPS